MNYVEQLLGDNESIVLVTHQHWSVLVRNMLIDLFVALLVVGITAVTIYLANGDAVGYVPFVLIIFAIIPFIYQFLNWTNREFIVTNRRVIQSSGIVNKNTTDSSLEKVNDVKLSQSFVGRMLDYGDVEILTASELGANLFRRIQAPIKFKTAMLNAKEKLGYDQSEAVPSTPGAPPAVDVPTLIAGLSALRQQGLITEEEYQKKKTELLERM